MKLFYTITSPYSRKVRVVIFEKGLRDDVEEIICNPFEDTAALRKLNPLGKIPTLVLDDGQVVYDSPVICEYLDTVNDNGELVPSDKERRLVVNRWQALADGIVDASYNIVMEGRRDKAERSTSSIARWQESIENGVDGVDRQIRTLPDVVTMAQISLGAALGYIDFRLPHIDWRSGHSKTAAWFKEFSQRPSMAATQPQG